MGRFALVLAVFPSLLAADGFVALDGGQIEAALNERALQYEGGATQDFQTSGRTLYNAGRDSWGYWTIRGDQYCSQWPPSDSWFCYDVAQSGDVVRFIAEDCSFSDGTYAQ